MVLTLPWAILSSYHKAFLQMAPGCPRMQGSEDPTLVEKSMSFAISGKIKALSSAICMILSTQITPQWMAGKGQHCTIIYDNHPTASDTNHWNTERLRALVVVYNELATLSKCQQAVRLYPFYGTCCRLFLLQLRSEMSNMSNASVFFMKHSKRLTLLNPHRCSGQVSLCSLCSAWPNVFSRRMRCCRNRWPAYSEIHVIWKL